jgi:hypothetical protein
MEENHKLALIISYYLSKYDRFALINLGYDSFAQAFRDIGDRLQVKPNLIKNMRENFDPLHPNSRVGWYQRELTPSRLAVVKKYGDLSEEALISVVKEILDKFNNNIDDNKNLHTFVNIIDNDDTEQENSREYTTRGVTGRRAEELFLNYFENGEVFGLSGSLRDTREEGCGYDYEMENEPNFVFEIKGLLNKKGGLSLTDKEWSVANKLGDRYFLILISNIEEIPIMNIFRNPSQIFKPKERVYTTISVNWEVDSSQLF